MQMKWSPNLRLWLALGRTFHLVGHRVMHGSRGQGDNKCSFQISKLLEIPNFQKRNLGNLENFRKPIRPHSLSLLLGQRPYYCFSLFSRGRWKLRSSCWSECCQRKSPRKSLTTRSSVRLPSVMADPRMTFAKDLFKRGAAEWMVDQVLCSGCLPPRVCSPIFCRHISLWNKMQAII